MRNKLLVKKIWLKKNELPILIIRSSAFNWFWHYFTAGLLLAADFFLMYFFWQYGRWGVAVFGLVALVSVGLIARSIYEYYFTGWILTNLRLIDFYQKGFLHRELTEVVYNKIKDVYAEKSGLVSGLFGFGDLFVTLMDNPVRLVLNGVRRYDRAVAEIILQQENYQKNLFNEKERRAQYLLSKIKGRLNDQEFNRLLGD